MTKRTYKDKKLVIDSISDKVNVVNKKTPHPDRALVLHILTIVWDIDSEIIKQKIFFKET